MLLLCLERGQPNDYVNLELPYNTGRVFLLTPNHCSIDTFKLVLVLYSAVTAQSDIPATEFPDYVRLMHQESDHRLDQVYKVWPLFQSSDSGDWCYVLFAESRRAITASKLGCPLILQCKS